VPLIVAGPGIPAGERSTEMVSLLDVAPTILDWVNAPRAISGMEGRSLLSPRTAAGPLALQTHGHDRRADLRGLREPSLKLLLDARSGERELYDLEEDPLERVDLYPSELALDLERQLDGLAVADSPAPEPADARELEALRSLGYVR
jgi:arylsulfatase A-like enzyme